MKKMIFLLIALMAVMSIHAQVVEVYKNNVLQATYYNTSTNKYKVKFKKASDGSNEQVDIYKNGEVETTYSNTTDNKYKVVFRELGKGKINNHEYVEIGGLKWATMNVGATTVAESETTAYGDYYAWGEIETYYTSLSGTDITWKTNATKTHITGTKTGYTGENYSTYQSYTITEWSPAPYDATTKNLTGTYDVAHTDWGSTWRMPTTQEFQKLYSACGGKLTSSLSGGSNTITAGGVYMLAANTTVDNETYKVQGLLFVSTEDTSLRLFFPAAGHITGTTRDMTTGFGDYWTSTYSNSSVNDAKCFYFKGNDNSIKADNKGSRYIGHTIRPVSE